MERGRWEVKTEKKNAGAENEKTRVPEFQPPIFLHPATRRIEHFGVGSWLYVDVGRDVVGGGCSCRVSGVAGARCCR